MHTTSEPVPAMKKRHLVAVVTRAIEKRGEKTQRERNSLEYPCRVMRVVQRQSNLILLLLHVYIHIHQLNVQTYLCSRKENRMKREEKIAPCLSSFPLRVQKSILLSKRAAAVTATLALECIDVASFAANGIQATGRPFIARYNQGQICATAT